MSDGDHHCPYCDLDYGPARFIVITPPSSGMPTVVTRDARPDEDTIEEATFYLRQVCRRLFGPDCLEDDGTIRFREGSENGVETKEHWHIHAERRR